MGEFLIPILTALINNSISFKKFNYSYYACGYRHLVAGN